MNRKYLSDWIIKDLERSGLAESIILEMGIEEIKGEKGKEKLKEILGFSSINKQEILQMTDCYLIPYPDGKFIRVKLSKKIEDAKYLSPRKEMVDTAFHLYYLVNDDGKVKNKKYGLIITEGEKKAAKLNQELRKLDGTKKLVAVGIPGITMWKDCPEWKDIRLSGREVYLCFDSDFEENVDVEYQMVAAFLWLRKKKANVKIITFDRAKGIDDYLVNKENERCKAEEELATLVENAQENIFDIVEHINYHKLVDAMMSVYYSIEEARAIWDECDLKKKYKIAFSTFKRLIEKTYKQKRERQEEYEDNNPEWLEIGKDGKGKVISGIVADSYFRKQKGDLIYAFQAFWRYEKGAWRALEDKHIKAEIQKMIGKELSTKFLVEDVIFQIENLALQTREFDFERNPWLLNFKNGVLDIKVCQFMEHKREYYQTIQFEFAYEAQRECPKWREFLESLELEEDTYKRMQEWAGYCLVPITPLQKCLFLKGDGDNGKSVILETIASMLNNVSTMEVHQLFEKFKVSELQGKLANICTDIQTTKIFSEEFKKIVSGEPVTAERKFRDPFKFRPFAKILFSANNFIPTKDRSRGFFRRFDILEFKKIFPKDQQDEFLKDKLREELPGIFNWAYEGLKRLMANNWKMTESKEMEQSLSEFKEASNPLQQFINEACEIDQKACVNTKNFRKEYENWCKEMGYEVLADNKLGQEMKRLGFGKARYQEGTQRPWFYTGITMKSI